MFWCCPVFCCLYSVLSTIIFPFFPGHRVLVLPSLLFSIWCSVHHYFPLLSWSSWFGVAQSFVVYMVFCPPLFPPSFLVIVFWCCPVFCCLYGVLSTISPPSFLVIMFWCCLVFCCLYSVLSTIISPFFPGHRVLVLLSLLLSIWCSVHHYFLLLSWSSCVSGAQSFVVYIVLCPSLFPPSFLVIVFWCCPVFCCLYGVLSTISPTSFLVIVFWCCPVFCCLYSVLSTIISPFFPGHRVLVLPSRLLSIWCSVHHYFLFFPGHRVLVLPSLLLSIWCSVHHYFPSSFLVIVIVC